MMRSALVDSGDQSRCMASISVIFGTKMAGEQPLLGTDAPQHHDGGGQGQQQADAGAKGEPPSERGEQQPEIARMADHAVDPVGDETMLGLDRHQAAETVAEHENGPEPQRSAQSEKGDADPAYGLAIDGPEVDPGGVGWQKGLEEADDRE